MWNYTINTVAYMQLPFDEILRSVSNAGFDSLELGESHINVFNLTRSEVKKLSEQFKDYGLKISAVMVEYGFDATAPEGHNKFSFGHSSPNESERQTAVRNEKRAIEMSVELGCSRVLTEFTGDIDRPAESKASFEKSINELLPVLEQNDVMLCVEPHPGDFIEDAFPALDILRSFHSKLVKYNYCVPHTFVLGHRPGDIVNYAKDILGFSHVADSINPQRIYFCPTYVPKIKPHLHLIPGLGDVDFVDYISSLLQVNFDGFLSLDVFSHQDRPTEAMLETKKRIEAITDGLVRGRSAAASDH